MLNVKCINWIPSHSINLHKFVYTELYTYVHIINPSLIGVRTNIYYGQGLNIHSSLSTINIYVKVALKLYSFYVPTLLQHYIHMCYTAKLSILIFS